jgi:TPR repeat protein
MAFQVGTGIRRDVTLAYSLFNIAAATGHEPAKMKRNELLEQLSSRELDEGQVISTQWKVGTPLPLATMTGRRY